jgi:hypothetical protein
MDMFRSHWEAIAATVVRQRRPLPIGRRAIDEWLPTHSRVLCVGTGLPPDLLDLSHNSCELLVCTDPMDVLPVAYAIGGDNAGAASVQLFSSLDKVPRTFARSVDGCFIFDSLPWLTAEADRIEILSSARELMRSGGVVFVQIGDRVDAGDPDYRLVSTTSVAGIRVAQWMRSMTLGASACEISELLRVALPGGEELEFLNRRALRVDAVERACALLDSCGFRGAQVLGDANADRDQSVWRSRILVARAS